MKAEHIKKLYLSFFERHGHKQIASASLVPENDPTVLFTTAGMHPLVPFLLGQPHPMGRRVVNVQKCIRTGDIDEVGDAGHLTFFEMMGNWSFGDYFKEQAIKLSFEFLTKELKFPLSHLAFTCFAGDNDAPKDEFSAKVWKSLGVLEHRIAFLPKSDNWWGPAGETGPCGPDTEMFCWNSEEPPPETFDPEDDRWVEIWNDVFMEYEKTKDKAYIPLKQKNVDTGLGLERVAMILQKKKTVYEIDTIQPIYDTVKKFSSLTQITNTQEQSLRIITDHLRASVFILGDERAITPSNVDQGYILRRFIRRSIRHLHLLKVEELLVAVQTIAKTVIAQFADAYSSLKEKESFVLDELKKETEKFTRTVEKGLRLIHKKIQSEAIKATGKKPLSKEAVDVITSEYTAKNPSLSVDSKWLFDLFQSQGMPPEMTLEEVQSKGLTVLDKEKTMQEFSHHFKRHQELSRIGAEKKFKGGLADDSVMTTRLHTATHLLNEALRQVLGPDIKQKGSNITAQRLRFDFNFPRKLTDEEKQAIEDLVNKKIQEGLHISKQKMGLEQALASGAQSEFGATYPKEVWVYSVGDFSKEICMGPHVKNTSELGHFRIKKEESSAAGVRRIKAVLE